VRGEEERKEEGPREEVGQGEKKRGREGPRLRERRERVLGWAEREWLLSSIPFPFLFFFTLPIQTKPFEFKYNLDSNLHIQHK
jgi:hypothetical protein